jgi:outer membrane lipoprotein-sorting protein
MRIRPIICALLAGAAFAAPAIPSAKAGELTPAESAALLKQLQAIREKQPFAQADFVEEKTTHLLNKPLVSEGTVAFEAPNKFRREVKGGNASLTVNDGKTMWVYYPNFKEAEHYTIGQRSFFDDSLAALTAGLNFEHIEEYYNFTASREGDGYVFQLAPKKPNLKRILDHLIVWMDSDFKVTKTELYMSKGGDKGDHLVTNYKNVKRDPLPASTFEFTPPADTHISYPLGK